MVQTVCKTCNSEFSTYPCRVKNGFAKYCSNPCKNRAMMGTHRGREIQKGEHLSPSTEFKKGQKSPNFKGGHRSKSGYLWIWKPKHHRAGKSGYVLNSVLVAEKSISRKLADDELVHHINCVKSDDRPENLKVIKKSDHMKIHKSRLGMKNSPEHKRKISLNHRRYQSPETRKKISDTMKRLKLSPQLYK
jgi:hypothetical protein